MKKQLIFLQLSVFYFFFLLFSPVYSEDSPKILLIINQVGSSKENTIDSKTFQTLLNSQLFKNGYQIINADELISSSSLTSKDILETKNGNMVYAVKAAASYNADFILSSEINSTVSSRQIYGMEMQNAVSDISYKLFDISTSKIVDIDSRQYRGGAKTAEEAKYESFKKMAQDVAKNFTQQSRYARAASSESSDSLSLSETPQPLPSQKKYGSNNVSSNVSSKIDTMPPKIILTSPSVSRGISIKVKSSVKETLIEGIVEDENDLDYLKINDERSSLNEKGRFSKVIALKQPDQKITIEASDIFGNRAVKTFDLLSETPDIVSKESALWGLSIGVSMYKNADSNLEYADKDALSIADFFKKQEGKLFSEVHFKTLVNEQVTRDSIIENISKHLNRAAPNDLVFIFIAGHGIKHRQTGSYYFVPYDTDINNIISRGLRMSDFEEAVKILSSNVNKVIIAMDTCHSGAMKVGTRAGQSGENLAEVIREASGVYVIAASKGEEVSIENADFKLHKEDSGHGVFTYALIKGMSGDANYDKNGYVSLNEIFQYVSIQIPKLTNGIQHPYFRSEGTDMPLVIINN